MIRIKWKVCFAYLLQAIPFPGAVICLHDGRGENGAPGRTIEALKKAIPLLKAQGYEFRRIEEKYGTAGESEID